MRLGKLVLSIATLLVSGCTLIYGGLDSQHGDKNDAGCTCKSQPADECLDASTLRVYVSIGSCASASCSYEHWDVLCESGCSAGKCVGTDLCDAVSCLEPPGPACDANDELVVYATSGTCSMGICSYASTQTMCTTGCANGACTGEPCAGVICDAPPASVCSDASTLTSYAAGACENGACSYASISTTCTSGCVNGACTNQPCAGVVCDEAPAATCLDANTRRSYASSGMCTDGNCGYAPTDTTCMNGCENGLCSGEACAGVTCDQPPARTCTSTTSLRTFAVIGTCSNGSCNYQPTDTPCVAPANGTASCASGACSYTCNTGYKVSGNSCILDGELSWSTITSGTIDDLNGLWGSGPNDVYAVGTDIILHGTNGGTTWTPTTGTAIFYGAWGTSASNVYAAGDAGLNHSTNGGANWSTNASVPSDIAWGNSIWGSGASDIYVIDGNYLFHTIDSGTTWTTPFSPAPTPDLGTADLGMADLGTVPSALLYSIWGSGPNDVYLSATTDSYVSYHSVNQGMSWDQFAAPFAGALWGSGPGNVFLVSTAGIARCTDGETWNTVAPGIAGSWFAVWGTSASNIYVAGAEGSLIHTTNGGTTWNSISTGTVNSLYAIWGSSANDVYVVGSAGLILHGQ